MTLQFALVRLFFTRIYPFRRGQGRILDRTWLGRLDLGRVPITTRTLEGFQIDIHPSDHIGRHIAVTGQFDCTIVDVLCRFSRPGDTLLDIGANIGYVSCCFLARVPSSQVVSVEPLPASHALLASNLARFPGRGTAMECAISDTEGVARLIVDDVNSGRSHLQSDVEVDQNVLQVRLVTPEKLLDMVSVEQIDLIKIDVEGHESRVIPAMRNLLEHHRPRAIVFEYQNTLAASSCILDTFHSCRYRVYGIVKRLTRFDLMPCNTLPASLTVNDYVAVQEDA